MLCPDCPQLSGDRMPPGWVPRLVCCTEREVDRAIVMVPPAHSMSQLAGMSAGMSLAWALSLRPQKMAEAIHFPEPPEAPTLAMSRQQRRHLARKGRR